MEKEIERRVYATINKANNIEDILNLVRKHSNIMDRTEFKALKAEVAQIWQQCQL